MEAVSLEEVMGNDRSFSEDDVTPKAGLSFTSSKAGNSERWFSVDFLGEAKGLSGSASSTLPSWHLQEMKMKMKTNEKDN